VLNSIVKFCIRGYGRSMMRKGVRWTNFANKGRSIRRCFGVSMQILSYGGSVMRAVKAEGG